MQLVGRSSNTIPSDQAFQGGDTAEPGAARAHLPTPFLLIKRFKEMSVALSGAS